VIHTYSGPTQAVDTAKGPVTLVSGTAPDVDPADPVIARLIARKLLVPVEVPAQASAPVDPKPPASKRGSNG
jgi:hypothetical protein